MVMAMMRLSWKKFKSKDGVEMEMGRKPQTCEERQIQIPALSEKLLQRREEGEEAVEEAEVV